MPQDTRPLELGGSQEWMDDGETYFTIKILLKMMQEDFPTFP